MSMLGRRTHSLGGDNTLRCQLNAAQQRITSLEGYIQSREREYQANVSRFYGERRLSRGLSITGGSSVAPRRRRVGRTQDVILTMRNSSIEEDDEDNDTLLTPLGEFCSLKIVAALSSNETTPIPFTVRRLIGRIYHIGFDGALIGTSNSCSIVLSAETEALSKHCQIFWSESTESGSNFVLKDLTDGNGVFYCCDSGNNQTNQVFPLTLSHGVRFVTGNLVWEMTALSPLVALTAKLFYFAKERNLPCLINILEGLDTTLPTLPTVTVTGIEGSISDIPLSSYDIDTEYEPPSYDGDEKFSKLYAATKSHGTIQVSVDTPFQNLKQMPRLLLHVAIENNDIDMVKYLLSRGSDVNKPAGELQYTAVHYAALRNNEPVMALLLQYGADMEIKNAEHLLPLSLTTSYPIRKLLLNSILLCAAADAGDFDEVTRLLMTTPPNVKGLRHKSALHLAASKGYGEIVEILLMNGVDVNLKGGTRQRTALHYASLNNHAAIIQLLLSAGAREFERDAGGYTPLNICKGDACRLLHMKPLSLCLAVQSGNTDQVIKILNESEDNDIINHRNDQNHAPLHLACIIGSMELVQLLVSHGAEVDIHGGSDSWTPLFYAAVSGHYHLVEFLMSVGANPEEQDSDGNTVRQRVMKIIEETEERMTRLKKRDRSESIVEINLAVNRSSVNMLRQESSPSCSVENELEWQNLKLTKLNTVLSLLTTPAEKLLAALNDKDLNKFISLLQSGTISPDATLDGSVSILVQVCEDGFYGFAKTLLEHGAKVSVNGSAEQIPLLVASSNGHVPILKLLIEHGADVNIQSIDTMNSALHEAASANDVEVVKYLLSAGANKGLVNISGELPFDCTTELDIQKLLSTGDNRLLVAAMVNDTSTLSRLITEEGVSVNVEFFRNGYTALHQASQEGHIDSVTLLLCLGADCNKKGGVYLQTPLHIASQNDHIEVAKVLLEHNAKVDIKDCDGKVPFEIATTNHMRKVLVEAQKVHLPFNKAVKTETKDENTACLICMDNPVNTIILPCGHQSFCAECVYQITNCALDRQPIREVISIFK